MSILTDMLPGESRLCSPDADIMSLFLPVPHFYRHDKFALSGLTDPSTVGILRDIGAFRDDSDSVLAPQHAESF